MRAHRSISFALLMALLSLLVFGLGCSEDDKKEDSDQHYLGYHGPERNG